MYLNLRLWAFTKGVRLRIAWTVLLGLLAASVGVLRLGLLGWLLGRVFQGASGEELFFSFAAVAGVMVLRGWLEYVRTMVAHRTSARVQEHLRMQIYGQVMALGPAHFTQERTGEAIVTLVDGVEQLEVYFGQYLPQMAVGALTPIAIFVGVAFLDWPMAAMLTGFALLTMIAPAALHRWDNDNSMRRSKDYGDFASEFLDAVQGLATLKAFGQSAARGERLAGKARALFRSTMWVLATNALSRGITDAGIALGAAAALALGAWRVGTGATSLEILLVVLMMGIEVFRPLRDLRTLLHNGMMGMSAAMGVFRLMDAVPPVQEANPSSLATDLPEEPFVEFDQVVFAYPGGRRAAHQGLSFRINTGERVGIVGTSGAGKSSIVRLLLRLYDPQEGTVRMGGLNLRHWPLARLRERMAIVNQDTYLFHGTVAENLLLGKPEATQDALEEAARAANAHEFIVSLPNGYQTIVGERGLRLSGGQRQRIAIARALLRDAPILVLDEALSSVDAENEAVIQQALERLMIGRTTLIFAHRLSSVISADRLLVLEEGRVVETGSHTDLMAQGGVYHTLMASQAKEGIGAGASNRFDKPDLDALGGAARDPSWTHDGKSEREVTLSTGNAGNLATDASLPSEDNGVEDNGAGDNGAGDNGAGDNGAGDNGAGDNGAGSHFDLDEPTDAILRAEGMGWISTARELLRMVVPWRGKLVLTFVLGITRVMALIGVGTLSALAVAALKHGESPAPWLWALIVAAPLAGILHWFESWQAHDMAFRLLAELRIALFTQLDRLAPAYLLRRRTGDLVAMATQDVETVEFFFAHTVAPAFVAVLVPGLVLATLSAFGWELPLALLPFLLVVALSPFLMRKRVDFLGSRAREALGRLNAHGVDSVQGLGELIAFQQADRRGHDFRARIREHHRIRLPFFADLARQTALLEVATGMGGLAVVVVGAGAVSAGTLEAAWLPLLTLLAMAAFLPISEIANVGRQLADTLGSSRRLHAVNNETPPVTDGPGVREKSPAGGVSLAMEEVTFRYHAGLPPALAEVNLAVPAGSTLALVGPSGAGKSTMAHLMMRFWDPEQGVVRLDGHDLREFNLDDLRRHLALVTQDTFLFNTTLGENIRLARPEATDENIFTAVDQAALGDFVAALPEGLDTKVGERGVRLSGGQRQRVAIARAFLKDAPVLILDEATSHLDAVSERLVREALDGLMHDRTTVVIAHRLSTVRNADRIVVLDEGHVADSGTHEELIHRGGLYAHLVGRQMAGTVDRIGMTPAADD